MLVGFAANSQAEGRTPVLYLTAPYNSEGEARVPVPEVVRGDPGEIRAVVDALPYAHKFTFGWLSFAEKARDMPESRQRRIIDAFEEAAFSGIDPTQRPPVLWVRHTHTSGGRLELHFMMPRFAYLPDGDIRSHNIAPPGEKTQEYFNTFRSMINAQYGLADPDDPARARLIRRPKHIVKREANARIAAPDAGPEPPGSGGTLAERVAQRLHEGIEAGEKMTGPTRLRRELKEMVADALRWEVGAGRVRDAPGARRFLEAEGFIVTRMRESAMSVRIPGTNERLRFSGALFRADAPPASPEAPRYERPDPEEASRFAAKLDRLKAMRAVYNQRRYGAPEAAAEDGWRSEALGDYLTRHLGHDAVRPGVHQFTGGLRAVRKQRLRRRRILHRNEALGTSWIEEVVEPEIEW